MKNNHRIHKVLSMLLCCVMLLSLLPAVASADVISNPFTDVKSGAYYEAPVIWAVENSITNGMDQTHFAPDNKCTREQVVTFLWRAVGSPETTAQTHPFVDVIPGSYYEKAVLWAVENGITNGMDDTHFSPSLECTRAQVAMFLWRALGKPAVTSNSNPFKDVADDQWFYSPVLWAVEVGVTNGLEPDRFAPDETCTRGQIVTFLYRSLKSLFILFHPADYHMQSSQETVDFVVQVKGGTAPYTFQWVILYDNEEVRPTATTASSPINALSWSFSDYDFDEYRGIGVYCIVTDDAGNSVETKLAEVFPYTPMRIVAQPDDYQMTSSQEDAEFTVSVVGGVGPYTYEWVLCCDNEEIWYQPELTYSTESVLSVEFTDYDFDNYNNIGVYCVITDDAGNSVETKLAEVFPYNPMRIVAQPDDYQMTSSQEDAEFTVSVVGGVGPYTYEWVLCCDNEEIWYQPELTYDTDSVFSVEISDYDFDEYRGIGVYCVITDDAGNSVESDFAIVLQK